jgi:hypothetical protein
MCMGAVGPGDSPPMRRSDGPKQANYTGRVQKAPALVIDSHENLYGRF